MSANGAASRKILFQSNPEISDLIFEMNFDEILHATIVVITSEAVCDQTNHSMRKPENAINNAPQKMIISTLSITEMIASVL